MTDKKTHLPSSSGSSGEKELAYVERYLSGGAKKTLNEESGLRAIDSEEVSKRGLSTTRHRGQSLSASAGTGKMEPVSSTDSAEILKAAALHSVNLLKNSGNTLMDFIEEAALKRELEDVISLVKTMAMTAQAQANLIKAHKEISKK